MKKEVEEKKEIQMEGRKLPEGYMDWRKEIVSLIEYSISLIPKVKDVAERAFYIMATAQEGWS